jgi:RNA 2',3'-cyclic 3'-phosphodiesterase
MRERAGATRRLFFALWPNEAQRGELEHAAAKAVRRCGGRPVPAANLHVTLAFLGGVASARIAELQRSAREHTASLAMHAPISLSFARLVHWKEAQILCALSAPESADARGLAVALQEAAAAIGLSPDRKPFRAHVTLARKVLHSATLPPLRPVLWRFDAFALVDSRTEPSGPVYSVVDSYPLVDDNPRD